MLRPVNLQGKRIKGMIDIEKAREWLRVDGDSNDDVIKGLLAAAPDYIEVATGINADEQEAEPLA